MCLFIIKIRRKENQKKRNIKSRKIDKRKRKILVFKHTITTSSYMKFQCSITTDIYIKLFRVFNSP